MTGTSAADPLARRRAFCEGHLVRSRAGKALRQHDHLLALVSSIGSNSQAEVLFLAAAGDAEAVE